MVGAPRCYLVPMPPRLVILPILPLCACGSWIYEEPTDAATVSWYGTILDGPYTGDNGVLTGGEVLVYDLDQELIAEGSEPSVDDSPGYWKLVVPPSTPVALHLAGEGMMPTVWRGTTPAALGYWYTGALFAYDIELWQPFFEQFEGQSGVAIAPLGSEVCWLWGSPWDPDAWAGADIAITDGDGESAVVLAYNLSDEGVLVPALNQPVHYFLAFNLAPGDVTLEVSAADGRSVVETWPAWPGEVVSAWYLALPPEDS
jgi:hypothetical protein